MNQYRLYIFAWESYNATNLKTLKLIIHVTTSKIYAFGQPAATSETIDQFIPENLVINNATNLKSLKWIIHVTTSKIDAFGKPDATRETIDQFIPENLLINNLTFTILLLLPINYLTKFFGKFINQ